MRTCRPPRSARSRVGMTPCRTIRSLPSGGRARRVDDGGSRPQLGRDSASRWGRRRDNTETESPSMVSASAAVVAAARRSYWRSTRQVVGPERSSSAMRRYGMRTATVPASLAEIQSRVGRARTMIVSRPARTRDERVHLVGHRLGQRVERGDARTSTGGGAVRSRPLAPQPGLPPRVRTHRRRGRKQCRG